jgi:hypothetical protein
LLEKTRVAGGQKARRRYAARAPQGSAMRADGKTFDRAINPIERAGQQLDQFSA